jgi:Ca2+-binding RTX toxin-like protein
MKKNPKKPSPFSTLKKIRTRFLENIVGGKKDSEQPSNPVDEEILLGNVEDSGLKEGAAGQIMLGSAPSDVQKGGHGDDVLKGGQGNDNLDGGH